MLLLHHKTLKGSRNIQGFALIRAVLFDLFFITFAIAKGYCNRVLDFFPVNNFVYRIHFWTLLLIFVLFAKTYSSRLQKLSMIEFVISNIRPVQNLLFMLIVTFQTRFVKLYFCYIFVFSRLNRLRPILYRLNGQFCGFERNIIFMFSSGLHKMLEILIENLVQVFHDNNFFQLYKFRPISYRFNGRMLRLSMGE